MGAAPPTPTVSKSAMLDLALSLWFLDAVRLRSEREGLTPAVLAALRSGHADVGVALARITVQIGGDETEAAAL